MIILTIIKALMRALRLKRVKIKDVTEITFYFDI